jgi:hypothetical protein
MKSNTAYLSILMIPVSTLTTKAVVLLGQVCGRLETLEGNRRQQDAQ